MRLSSFSILLFVVLVKAQSMVSITCLLKLDARRFYYHMSTHLKLTQRIVKDCCDISKHNENKVIMRFKPCCTFRQTQEVHNGINSAMTENCEIEI